MLFLARVQWVDRWRVDQVQTCGTGSKMLVPRRLPLKETSWTYLRPSDTARTCQRGHVSLACWWRAADAGKTRRTFCCLGSTAVVALLNKTPRLIDNREQGRNLGRSFDKLVSSWRCPQRSLRAV